MPNIAEQLTYLTHLNELMKNAPASARALLIADAETKLEGEKQKEHKCPTVELRWLHLNLMKLKTDPEPVSGSPEENASQTKTLAYSLAAYRCKEPIKDFVAQYREDQINDKEELKKLIKKQQELIFSQCLTEATRQYLSRYKVDSQFSQEAILSDAVNQYKEKMYKETLLEFELGCLIERLSFLEDKKISGLSTDPEVTFVNERLAVDNLADFRLSGTKHLAGELVEYNQEPLTLNNIRQQVRAYFKEYGEKDIHNKMDSPKTIIEYFVKLNEATPVTISLVDYMTSAITRVEELRTTVQSLATEKEKTESSKNQGLLKLKNIVEIYSICLPSIKKQELEEFPDRNPIAMKNREDALTTISNALKDAEQLTPELRRTVKQAVDNIQANNPTWFERSLVDQILDIITLGIKPLIRYCTFKPEPVEASLHDVAEENAPASEDVSKPT